MMKKIKISKLLKIIYIVCFLIMCLAPMSLFIYTYSDSMSSENFEKSEVLTFPVIYNENGLNTSFGDECEAWLNQNIPYREILVTQINKIMGGILKNPEANVVVGQDNWLYSQETIADYLDTNRFSDADIKRIGITLSLIKERIEAEGGKFLFVPVPNKNSIYSEYMPQRYIKASVNNLDRLYKELDKIGVNYSNLKDVLLKSKDSYDNEKLYYKKDTHWTALGAVAGYETIMNDLGIEYPSIDNKNYTVSYNRISDLDKLLYPNDIIFDEEIILENPVDYDSFVFMNPSGVVDTKAQLENFMSDKEDHDNNFTTKQKQADNTATLYMIRDSFARALLPYMIDSFSEATFVRSATPSIENAANCSDVIYEICERNLKNIYASAPYMYAPKRDEVNGKRDILKSDKNICYCSDEGYAYRIYGILDSRMYDNNGRIYVILNDNNSQKITYEAFPIYEEALLAERSLNDNVLKDNESNCGFSLYIDKRDLELNDYKITVASDKYESEVLADISVNNDNLEASLDIIDSMQNPYEDENAPHQIMYNDVPIRIGDNINILKNALGNQAAPSEIIYSCLSGTDAIMYYYPNITIEADMEGNIYYISLMDNSYSDGEDKTATASGIYLGCDNKEIWNKLGEADKENDKNCIYLTEHLAITYSYKNGLVTGVILEDKKYKNEDELAAFDEADEIPGVKYESGNTYLYDDGNAMQTGWQIIDSEYYFFDRLTGERIVGQTVDGIKIADDGSVSLSDYDKLKIETMMKAHNIMLECTNPTDTMEEKRRKVFDWIMSFPYHRYRNIGDVYTQEGIEIIEANDIFDEGAGDCVSESAALAFLFHEIGYNNVYWVHDTGHSWVRSDDKLYDPLFAEARDFDANYDAPFTDYRDTMAHSMLIY